jgi:hypothetical protein
LTPSFSAVTRLVSKLPSGCFTAIVTMAAPVSVRQDIGQHRDIRSDDVFGLAALVGDMNDAAVFHQRYRAYGGVRHDAFGSLVPGPLTFADPPHRFREDAQLNGVNLAVGATHAARSDKISGSDVTETAFLNAINLRIG